MLGLPPQSRAWSLLARLAHVSAARREPLELHQLDDQFGATGQERFFQQGLLRTGIERCNLGNGVDEHFVVEPPDRAPVDRQPQRIPELASLAFDRAAHD